MSSVLWNANLPTLSSRDGPANSVRPPSLSTWKAELIPLFRGNENQDMIMKGLNGSDMLRLSFASKSLRDVVAKCRQRTFISGLRRFIPLNQIPTFRHIQEVLGVVISGSIAIQFFDGDIYDGCDLDLYVHSVNAPLLIGWLTSIGYTLSRSTRPFTLPSEGRPIAYMEHAIVKVETFTKDSRAVQVISTRNTVIETILDFSLTCAMNLITHKEAISLYPHATFERRECLVLDNRFISTRDTVVEKYRRHGWKIIETLDASTRIDPKSDFYCPTGAARTRFVGDKLCWKISLDEGSSHIGSNALQHDPLYTNSWRLSYDVGAFTSFVILKNRRLAQSYVIAIDAEVFKIVYKEVYAKCDTSLQQALSGHFSLNC
ncbi:hypothetical protein BDN72DRAFT_901579 [Pluteus cervinus]|uniref:Uncharacterized protein n=1 Tax=Pluteus cervinus TaxID=181527 RepID=A0ACD3AFA1_9AGAR|nr:hypothetical protein BDN72DRAFT_901579 [Pluteus cervinus]